MYRAYSFEMSVGRLRHHPGSGFPYFVDKFSNNPAMTCVLQELRSSLHVTVSMERGPAKPFG